MKLIVDIQAAQTAGSKNRGIGRYSLALAQEMARQAGKHEIWIAANAAFSNTVEPLRHEFNNLIPPEQFVTWEIPAEINEKNKTDIWRSASAEMARESFLASLKPDYVHVSSLFEGPGDNSATSIGALFDGNKSAVTLYDLIPLVNSNKYLTDQYFGEVYRRKLASLRRAGLWLAISEYSRQEAMDWLGLPSDKITTIYPAAEKKFHPTRFSEDDTKGLLVRYGLKRSFVMYTGGVDHRKNIQGLITAYAKLPTKIRNTHQLAIVCAAQKEAIFALKSHGTRQGLRSDELVLTGFVPDSDLIALYNLCKVFCFPSWHEGFGLPVLEAMQCGAATIGSNTSSIPEVLGCPDALFDPHNSDDITSRLKEVLINDDFRIKLSANGLIQAKKFDWVESAKGAWQAFERHQEHAASTSAPHVSFIRERRPRLAYVSPLPPEKTGIADYNAELLPELARHYEIDAIVDQSAVTDKDVIANCRIRNTEWFEQNANRYDRIVYHFGNSLFHKHMLGLLPRYPGVVVLHDFYLSGLIAHLEFHDRQTIWSEALYSSHGFSALQERAQALEPYEIVYKYPVNFPVIRDAEGIIVHSEYSRGLGRRFYGAETIKDWSVIPLARRLPPPSRSSDTRTELGINDNAFIVCSFGMTGPTKLNQCLVRAWSNSILGANEDCYLIFVGEEHGGPFRQELRDLIQTLKARKRIKITGFASPDLYEKYLRVADVAVQLRTLSRGESSRSVADCLAYGVPTIVNAHGSAAELSPETAFILPDQFSDAALSKALEQLYTNDTRRKSLGESARKYVKDNLSPRHIADRYMEAIEYFSDNSTVNLKRRIVTELAERDPEHQSEADWLAISRAVARNIPNAQPQRQILIEVSSLVADKNSSPANRPKAVEEVLKLLINPPPGYRTEPIYLCQAAGRWHYRYARNYAAQLLELERPPLDDLPIEVTSRDVFFGLSYIPTEIIHAFEEKLFDNFQNLNLHTVFVAPMDVAPEDARFHLSANDQKFRSCLLQIANRIICPSPESAKQISAFYEVHSHRRPHARDLDIVELPALAAEFTSDLLIHRGKFSRNGSAVHSSSQQRETSDSNSG